MSRSSARLPHMMATRSPGLMPAAPKRRGVTGGGLACVGVGEGDAADRDQSALPVPRGLELEHPRARSAPLAGKPAGAIGPEERRIACWQARTYGCFLHRRIQPRRQNGSGGWRHGGATGLSQRDLDLWPKNRQRREREPLCFYDKARGLIIPKWVRRLTNARRRSSR